MDRKISNADVLAQLHQRYAVKRFDPARPIPEADWETLEQAAILTPSSYGLQPWAFVVVRDPELRAKLRPVSWNQSQVTDASHLMVFAIKARLTEADVQKFIDRTVTVRNAPPASLEGYKKMMVQHVVAGLNPPQQAEWMARQLYIALGNVMTTAAMMGIDTCPLEGIDPVQYDEILGLKPQGLATKCALALGFRHAEDKYALAAKVRYEKPDVIFYK